MGGTNGTTPGATAGALAALCGEAERIGAGALWSVDHLFWPRPLLECLTTLTVAATATERVVIGSCVLQLPLRSPPAVAKQAAAISLLSGGRFVLGVGVGRHRGEYAAAGVDFSARGRLTDEGIAALRRAWGHEGAPAAPYVQAPPSPPVPVWVGGSSDAALARAATAGDGWIPLFVPAGSYAGRLDDLARRAERHGRAPDEVVPAAVALVRVGGPEALADGTGWLSSLYGLPPAAFERHLIAGSPEACADGVVAYLDAGAHHVAVMVAGDQALEAFSALVDALGAGHRRGRDQSNRRQLEVTR